jgi:hypothetical protein
MIKTKFGNFFTRLLWGGVRLFPLESTLLRCIVDELPKTLHYLVEAQFQAHNRASREADGRAIKFRMKLGGVDNIGRPLLDMKGNEAPILRAASTIGSDEREYHGVPTAVNGRVFCLTFDLDVRSLSRTCDFAFTRLTWSWRPNFKLGR